MEYAFQYGYSQLSVQYFIRTGRRPTIVVLLVITAAVLVAATLLSHFSSKSIVNLRFFLGWNRPYKTSCNNVAISFFMITINVRILKIREGNIIVAIFITG
jgi:hypothetical protein